MQGYYELRKLFRLWGTFRGSGIVPDHLIMGMLTVTGMQSRQPAPAPSHHARRVALRHTEHSRAISESYK